MWTLPPECFDLTKHTPATRRLVKNPEKRKRCRQKGPAGPITDDSNLAWGAVVNRETAKKKLALCWVPSRKWHWSTGGETPVRAEPLPLLLWVWETLKRFMREEGERVSFSGSVEKQNSPLGELSCSPTQRRSLAWMTSSFPFWVSPLGFKKQLSPAPIQHDSVLRWDQGWSRQNNLLSI